MPGKVCRPQGVGICDDDDGGGGTLTVRVSRAVYRDPALAADRAEHGNANTKRA